MGLHKYRYQPVANGLRTDHPIPDLPFVDDSHLPLDDRAALEAVGRTRGAEGMWGRADRCLEGGWVAFTTDPVRHDLAWCVRAHPVHGRSVVLYRDDDASPVHMVWWGPPLLFRAGGYWWDGMAWYRPPQIWDRAREDYVRRAVPAAVTVTAADLLASGDADPSKGRLLGVTDIDLDTTTSRWLDDLALWADRHGDEPPLSACVVGVNAPELAADQLMAVAELAAVAEIAPSTLRAYVSRGENEVPQPQATVAGRAMWARPVAQEWAEQRRRSTEGIEASVATRYEGVDLAPGVVDLWKWFTRGFLSVLWHNPGNRKHWALRWRTEERVREVASNLGWIAAGSLDRIVPIGDLAGTVRHAVLDELAIERQRERSGGEPPNASPVYDIASSVAGMLDWLIRHDPSRAEGVIGDIVGDAEDRFDIPRETTAHSLRTAMSLGGKLDYATYAEFFDRALPPTTPLD